MSAGRKEAPSVRQNPKQHRGGLPSQKRSLSHSPAPLNVVGEQITVLAPGCRTGAYEIFRQAGPEGSGPRPHYHPWDESFYVVSGKVAFGVGEKERIAEPGTLVHLPGGTMHWFRYGQGGGEMISMTSREAASLFFTDVDRAISPEAPDIPKFLEIAKRHQLTVAKPTG